MNKKIYYLLPFINLQIATLLGVFLRYLQVSHVEGLNFKYVLHAHSHVAFLGWVFMGLFLLLVNTVVPEEKRGRQVYRDLYILNQISVLGMLLSFPVQGYALFSITFSTLHIILSYIFAVAVWKDTVSLRSKTIQYFLRAALIFMVISSFGPWSLAAIMAKGMSGTPLYDLSIYFYLHFQYNGWFTFALLALLLVVTGNPLPEKEGKLFFWLLIIATVPAYASSVLFVQQSFAASFISFLSAALELFALGYLLKIYLRSKGSGIMTGVTGLLVQASLLCLLVKTGIQIGAAFFTAFHIRHFLIGYLHLALLGFVSLMLLGLLVHYAKPDRHQSKLRWGAYLYLTGFVLSETLIFLQGFMAWAGLGMIPSYFMILLLVSVPIPLGVGLFLTAAVGKGKKAEEGEKESAVVVEVV